MEFLIVWVKKTLFNKTESCLLIFYLLLKNRKIKKSYLEKILEVDSRTTIYNYVEEIKNFINDMDNYLDVIIDIYYEDNYYYLELNIKK